MSRNEFILLHGETAWENLVKPKQEHGNSIQQANANAIIHHDVIMPTLRLLGLSGVSGILEAQQHIK